MSLRWTLYVALKPLKGTQKHRTAVFHVKLHFAWRKSAAKFLCVTTIGDKVVRYSFAYLFMYKWLVEDVPFFAKIWWILTHPLQNADFQSVFACSASAITPSKKVWFTLMGSPLHAFQWAWDDGHLPFWLPGFVKLTMLLLHVLFAIAEIKILLLLLRWTLYVALKPPMGGSKMQCPKFEQ